MKVHFRGIPCNCQKRWNCCQLTSIGNKSKVTCKNCLRHLNRKEKPQKKVESVQDSQTEIVPRLEGGSRFIKAMIMYDMTPIANQIKKINELLSKANLPKTNVLKLFSPDENTTV